jgi:hypothetical protein
MISVSYDANDYMDTALAPVKLANKIAIMKSTWGHLAPRRNKIYRGYIVFSKSAYGEEIIIDADFVDLPDSPWIFEAMRDFCFPDDDSLLDGAVYRFQGTLRNYTFSGIRRVLYAPNVPPASGKASTLPAQPDKPKEEVTGAVNVE